MDNNNLPALRISSEATLPSTEQWQNRFQIRSETSNRKYVIAQNKRGRFWGCSCPGWKKYRHCKHLDTLGLPGHSKPHEVNVVEK